MVIVEENGIELWVEGELQAPLERDTEQRKVYLFEDYVIKIDTNLEDMGRYAKQTATEIEHWERMEEADRKHFAEILDYGFTAQGKAWYKQKRYYSEIVSVEIQEKVEELSTRFGLEDVYAYCNTAKNFAVYQNTPVIYDWAI